MTITFTDSDGRERRLCAHLGGAFREATVDDLTRAGFVHVPDTHEVIPKGRHEWVLKSDLDAAKTEVDRLTAERDDLLSQLEAINRAGLEQDADLAATKEKLAEVERERDSVARISEGRAKQRDELSIAYHQAQTELERARPVVEAAGSVCEDWNAIGLVSAKSMTTLVRSIDARSKALASAAPAADRTEAPKCCFACGDRLMTVWFAPEFCDEQCARDWSDALPEPPRAEAGESGPVCLTCGGAGWAYVAPLPGEPAGETVDCPRCASEESKPEPQPSAPEPSASVPRSEVLRLVDAARREPLSPAESFLADAVELLAKGEVKSG
jgi:hypothetical protein